MEILFGSYGIIIPFVAIVVFYLTIVYNAKLGIVLAITFGFVLDVLYARTYYVSPVTLSLVSLFAVFWLRKGNLKDIRLQMLPGAVIAFICIIPHLVINYFLFEGSFFIFFINILVLMVGIISGAILLPFIILVLDSLSRKLKLNLYVNSKKRLIENR
jgi:cell shape-determining protein MreD